MARPNRALEDGRTYNVFTRVDRGGAPFEFVQLQNGIGAWHH